MKKTLALLVVVSVLAAAAYAVDVRSINTAGYHSHTIPVDEQILVAPTLDNMDGVTLNEILGDQLPIGSVVNIWNGGGWSASQKDPRGWTDPGVVIIRGGAMFVAAPPGQGPFEFSFTGEVPEPRNGGGTTVVSVTGIDAVSYGYPVAAPFVSTDLASTADDNSVVNFWDGTSYTASQKDPRGWTAPADTRVLGIGEGFFFEPDSGSQTWTEEQPYDLQN